MKLKELIKRIEDLPYTEGPIADTITINRDWILESIEQLDEPEAGNADEAPRYLKNILARLRELPLHDREVWLKAIMGEFEKDFSRAKWREGYEQGKFEGEWAGQQLKDADKIRQELNKVKVPQCVADWYEINKNDLDKNIVFLCLNWEKSINDNNFFNWMSNTDNFIQTLVNMHQFGYEVEKEKRYEVILCNGQSLKTVYRQGVDRLDFEKEYGDLERFTRKQLEEANFGWVFDCPGIEVEEVE